MDTVKTKLNTFRIDAKCECGGIFKRHDDSEDISTSLLTYPPLYSHQCDRCLKIKLFREIYPKITYEDNNDDLSKPINKITEIKKHNVSNAITIQDLDKVQAALTHISRLKIVEHDGFVDTGVLYRNITVDAKQSDCIFALQILESFIKGFIKE